MVSCPILLHVGTVCNVTWSPVQYYYIYNVQCYMVSSSILLHVQCTMYIQCAIYMQYWGGKALKLKSLLSSRSFLVCFTDLTCFFYLLLGALLSAVVRSAGQVIRVARWHHVAAPWRKMGPHKPLLL